MQDSLKECLPYFDMNCVERGKLSFLGYLEDN